MILYHRRGARVRRLRITEHGAGIYRARWGKTSAFFEAFGEPQDIITAAVAAIEKEEL